MLHLHGPMSACWSTSSKVGNQILGRVHILLLPARVRYHAGLVRKSSFLLFGLAVFLSLGTNRVSLMESFLGG